MIVVGLTGSIGMGKSTTARMFAQQGASVWDADAAVHRLYAPGGEAVEPVARAFGDVKDDAGGIDRTKLGAATLGKPDALNCLESIVHPLVRADQARFLVQAQQSGADIVVLDIPLLVESGQADQFDDIVVVTADPEVRRARVLGRPGMTAAKLDAILARQADEATRIAAATYVVRTDRGLKAAEDGVKAMMAALREKHGLPIRAEHGSGTS